MSDPLTECNAAVTELHQTDVYKRRKSQAQYDGTHTGLAEAHVKAAIAGLTVTPPPPPPPPPPPTGRIVPVANPSQLSAAINGALTGDTIRATGTFAYQYEIRRTLPAGVILDFTAAKFPGPGLVGLFIVGAGNVVILGGEYTNPAGDGIRVENCPGLVQISDPLVHGTGSQGILVQGNGGPNKQVKLIRPNVYGCGKTAYDSHAAAGTGLHCIYFGGALSPSSGEIIDAHCHDQEYGAGIEFGANAVDVICSNALIEHMNGAQYGDAGGNAFNIWGGGNRNVLIDSPRGSGITGNVVRESGVGGLGAFTVQHARFGSSGRSPMYMPSDGITYVDCS